MLIFEAYMTTSILHNDSEHSTVDEAFGLMSALRVLNEEALKNGSAGMSEEEIEAEIKAARAKIKR